MIDISDGVATDLRHVCKASEVGAVLDLKSLPISAALLGLNLSQEETLHRALSDGEDFELCFTASRKDAEAIIKDSSLGFPVTVIGECIQESGFFAKGVNGVKTPIEFKGYEHNF
jgi:thiamine-monophosphate kinase